MTQRSAPLRGGTGWATIVIVATLLGSVVVLGASTPDAQMFLAITAIVAVVATFAIPHAVHKEPTVSVRFLAFALAAHVVGSLARYVIIQTVYHGVADANGYFGAGTQLAPLFRSLQFPPFPQPGTEFMNWLTGLIFAVTTPTLLGGFVICASLGFVGSWYFYKAFRVGFPNGDHRTFAYLIFLLPTMWYWPSSLGKDGIIVLFMGISTYGLALILRSVFLRGFVIAILGLAGTLMIRPPMAAALSVAAASAFLVRPARLRSIQMQALMWLVIVPLLGVLSVVTINSSRNYVKTDDPIAAFEAQQSKEFQGQGGGSNYAPPNPFSPLGAVEAVVTVNFRPFPWEAGGYLPGVAALEGLVVLLVVLRRRSQLWAALRSWRENGGVAFAFLCWLFLSIILSSLSNFGLLARQRTQVLPFLFILLCAVPRRRRRAPAQVQRRSDIISV